MIATRKYTVPGATWKLRRNDTTVVVSQDRADLARCTRRAYQTRDQTVCGVGGWVGGWEGGKSPVVSGMCLQETDVSINSEKKMLPGDVKPQLVVPFPVRIGIFLRSTYISVYAKEKPVVVVVVVVVCRSPQHFESSFCLLGRVSFCLFRDLTSYVRTFQDNEPMLILRITSASVIGDHGRATVDFREMSYVLQCDSTTIYYFHS